MEGVKFTTRLVVEIIGAPKEHVEHTLKEVIGTMKKDKRIKLLKETAYKAEEVDKLWSSFADLEMEVTGMNDLIGLSFDYMPSSIEILEPKDFKTTAKDAADLLNDLLAKLHQYDMFVKNLQAENILLKRKLEKK